MAAHHVTTPPRRPVIRKLLRPLSLGVALSIALPLAGVSAACSASEGAVSGRRPGSGTVGAAGIGDPDFPGDGNGGYDVDHYGLKLSYDPGSRRLSGSATVRARAVQDLTAFDLDLHGLTVSRVIVDGAAARFARHDDELTISPATRIAKNARFDVTVDYAGVPDPIRNYANLGSYGFIATPDGSFVTCEPNGAKTWFPSNDHPSDKATYAFEITVPAGVTAIANGELGATPVTSDGRTTFVWRERHPMASYLATMTTGRFETRTGKSAAGTPIYAAVDPAFHGSLDTLYTKTGQITDYWSTVFGPYPFSSTGAVVDDYAAGYALENQTKPIYGGFTPDSGVMAHELAHQWFGDSVSITRWKDLWLNEGFATYAEWLWSEHEGGSTADTVFRNYYAKTADPMWSYPPGRAQRADLFNGSVYTRGAMTLHALRRQIGDTTFFALIKNWTAAHQYGNATTEQFVGLAQQVSGKDLSGLFDAWLFQPQRPAAVI